MVIFIGGSKGGVGKSLMAMIILYYFISNGEKPILIETDTDNPDVLKSYSTKGDNGFVGKDCYVYICNLDNENGWEKLFDIVNDNPGRPIIVNSAARNSVALANFGDTLNQIREFKTIWLINDQADSLNLLMRYMNTVHQPISIVKNGFFGLEDNFNAFDGSKAARAGLQSVYLPKATDAIISAIYTGRHSLSEVVNEDVLTFGQRILARSWLNKVAGIAESALNSTKMITIKD